MPVDQGPVNDSDINKLASDLAKESSFDTLKQTFESDMSAKVVLTDKGVPLGVVSPDEILNETVNPIGMYEIPVETMAQAAKLLGAALINVGNARRIGLDSFGEIIENQLKQCAEFLGINFIAAPPTEEKVDVTEPA